MLGFIHITKTGGVNLKDKNKNTEILFGDYHYENAEMYKKKNIKCFTIMRDPVERYKSLFYYNTRGSNKYKKTDKYYNAMTDDINFFVNEHFKDKNLINRYEKGWQFKKQVDWLENADPNETFIVKYDKENLINNIRELYSYNKINFIYDDKSNNINTTNYINARELSEESRDKIKEMYIEDIKLYNKLTALNKPFCKLSELYSN
jgi:hypothetical protein